MATINATVTASLSIQETGVPPVTQQNLVNNINKVLATAYASGTASGQVDTIYATSGTFTASTAKTWILSSAGTLKDSFGNAVAMVRLKVLYLANLATVDSAANTLTIGGGTNPIIALFPSTSTVVLPPGGTFLISAPLATGYITPPTGTEADTLTVTPGSGTPAFEIIFLGCSA